MKQLSGGQAAVASLQTEKVEQVFGLIGSATMEMFDARYDATDINFIGVHDERTGEVGEAVQAALDCGRPAVIDIAIDPAALYSFRRDSFKHRGG